MKIDFNRVDDLNARLTIVIEAPDYAPKLEENLKTYGKKMNIKGFRAGKTPKSVLTKMYGKGMLEESVTSILNDRLFKYLEEEKIDIFGSPMMAEDSEPVDFNPKVQEDYQFIFDLGIKPAFELNYGLEDPLEIMVVEPDQSAIDEDILRYRRVFGLEDTITDGSVEQHDRVGVRLNRILEDGLIEDKSIETVIDLERIKGSASSSLMDLTLGAIFQADLEELYGYKRDVLIKNTLALEEDPAPDSPLLYQVEVFSIARPQTVELTGEQISKYVGQPIEDEAGFRKILENRDANTNLSRTTDMKKMAVRTALLKANPFNIPEDFLLRWVNSQRDNKMEYGSREAKNLFREARWSLLLNRIRDEVKLEVTEKDIQKQVTNWIVENVNYMQTDIRKLMKELHANEYFMSTMKENALEEVVLGHIISEVNFVEKPASVKEFEHAFHEMHHELFDHEEHSH